MKNFALNAALCTANAVQKYFAQDTSRQPHERAESIKIERISDK
jgi:hypothetical protein